MVEHNRYSHNRQGRHSRLLYRLSTYVSTALGRHGRQWDWVGTAARLGRHSNYKGIKDYRLQKADKLQCIGEM